ncbi:MAG: alpha-1,2-fucosyltransferase, partial [Rhizonema sp. PD38]|nr:alpha-1,2-fucosyltransferase [Rhizonema sp. PD38]
RKYGLHCFNIQEHIASQDEINVLLKRPRNRINRLFNKSLKKFGIVSKQSIHLLQERFFHFDSDVLKAPNNSYLYGYWQSDKYFTDIRHILLSEFSIKYPQNYQNEELSEKIQFHESVSLHVRRGDYFQDEKTYQFHGICSLDYYKCCMNYIAEKVTNPQFFVFSDDSQWVKENLKGSFPITIVENNGGFKSYEDLRLMTQCKHNIIANSSFSWWGAWLNPNPYKIVCTPQQWFKKQSTDTKFSIPEGSISWYKDKFVDTKDLIPLDWIKL